jgi:Tfp pilus assembly protein PilX
MKRHSQERGGVTLILILVLLVLAALVGALAVRGSTSDLTMAGSQRQARTGFYCAEAGLNAARAAVAAMYPSWNSILAGTVPTGVTYPIVGDIDSDGTNDWSVTIRDNVDENPTNDPTTDHDLTVIMISQCTNPNFSKGSAQRTLEQIVTYTGNLGTDYRYQAGHSSTHSGNAN